MNIQEIQAEAKELLAIRNVYPCKSYQDRLTVCIEAMLPMLADAERYQWWVSYFLDQDQKALGPKLYSSKSKKEVDAAIDAAIQESKT